MLKKIIVMALTAALLFCITSCKQETAKPEKKAEKSENEKYVATKEDAEFLESFYSGRKVFHGEMHDHSDSGGTSDGHYKLADWTTYLRILRLDFAAILDHKQVLHMYSPDWDSRFIGGSEAGSQSIDGSKLHYNMVFAEPQGLLNVLNAFPEFEYTGGTDGHFKYPDFTRERFTELSEAVRENGGYLVIPHPSDTVSCIPKDGNPECFWYGDYNGLEVLYQSVDSKYTAGCYELWKNLLSMGRRVYACAGGDGHNKPDTDAMTTVYAVNNTAAEILSVAKTGDSTAGGVGIRMVLKDVITGGHKKFVSGENLIIAAGDFHKDVIKPVTSYKIRVYSGEDVILDEKIDTKAMNYFKIPSDESSIFYRAEVYGIDKSGNECIVAYGNPIWNDFT